MTIFIYSILSYLIGVAGLVYIILWMAGVVPGAFGGPLQNISFFNWVWDVLLLLLFGLQHTVMARKSFKQKIMQTIPASAERSTYVLVTGIALLLMVGLWSPMPAIIWQVELSWLTTLLWGLFIFGWSLCLYATFAINHFDLMGLRQGYLHFKGEEYSATKFKNAGLYSYVRHPIQTGVLIGMWCIPTMTLEHLLMSLGITIYVFIGLYYEEKDLISQFGEQYINYKKQVGGLLPRFGANSGE